MLFQQPASATTGLDEGYMPIVVTADRPRFVLFVPIRSRVSETGTTIITGFSLDIHFVNQTIPDRHPGLRPFCTLSRPDTAFVAVITRKSVQDTNDRRSSLPSALTKSPEH